VGSHDLQEIDSAQSRGIDTIREIRSTMVLAPMTGPTRVWIMDEVHQLSKDAQSGLLKALEDTPGHVYFMLATTDPDKLLPTLRNRCTEYRVAPLSDKEMTDLLLDIADAEKKNIPEEVLDIIVAGAMGSSRSALVVLDKIIELPAKQMADSAQQQILQQNEAIELCRLLMGKAKWDAVVTFLKNTEQEPESLRRLVLSYCTSVLLGKNGNPKAYVVLTCFSKPFYDTGKAGLVMACWEAVMLD
jgi:DNA polymerase III gamma/tau subunit